MQSDFCPLSKQHRFVIAGLLAMAAGGSAAAQNTPGDTYTWSAEIATSPRRAARYEEAVAAVRPYNDVR
jgi:hypothetical protein